MLLIQKTARRSIAFVANLASNHRLFAHLLISWGLIPMNDPVLEHVRAAREHLGQEAGFDIHTIAQNARMRDEKSGANLIMRSRRIPVVQISCKYPMRPGGSGVVGMENSVAPPTKHDVS